MRQSSRPYTQSARRWGRTPECAHAHAAASLLQIRHPDLVIWFGETSRRYFVMDADGLHEFPDTDAVLLFAWHRHRRPPRRVANRPLRFDDGLDDLRESLSGPLRELIAARPDLAHTPADMAGER